MTANRPSVLVFDVNETLSDLTPLRGRFEEIGAPADLMPLWFAGILRDGFALAAAGGYADFAVLAPWGQDAGELSCGAGLVGEGTQGALAHHGVEGGVRVGQVLGVAGSERHSVGETGGCGGALGEGGVGREVVHAVHPAGVGVGEEEGGGAATTAPPTPTASAAIRATPAPVTVRPPAALPRPRRRARTPHGS